MIRAPLNDHNWNLLTEVNKKFLFCICGKFLICLIKKTWALLSLSLAPFSPAESLTGFPRAFHFARFIWKVGVDVSEKLLLVKCYSVLIQPVSHTFLPFVPVLAKNTFLFYDLSYWRKYAYTPVPRMCMKTVLRFPSLWFPSPFHDFVC